MVLLGCCCSCLCARGGGRLRQDFGSRVLSSAQYNFGKETGPGCKIYRFDRRGFYQSSFSAENDVSTRNEGVKKKKKRKKEIGTFIVALRCGRNKQRRRKKKKKGWNRKKSFCGMTAPWVCKARCPRGSAIPAPLHKNVFPETPAQIMQLSTPQKTPSSSLFQYQFK